jgi:hypothetical protein
MIKLDTIVGSVGKTRDFDRRFRPRSARSRQRWEQLALAARRGEGMPPIHVYRVGDLHFVSDGHHRVSVAHALRLDAIEANVTEVRTKLSADGIRHRGDLVLKDWSASTSAASLPDRRRRRGRSTRNSTIGQPPHAITRTNRTLYR